MLSQNCTKWKSGLVKIAISKDCVKLDEMESKKLQNFDIKKTSGERKKEEEYRI